MKMSPTLFADLKRDCLAIVDATGHDPKTPAQAFNVFHKVNKDRSYDDNHPGYVQGYWTRVLPCNRAPAEPFIDRFYKDEDLNDDHIRTALKAIFPKAFRA